jgi:Alpha/beta hydrolase domain
MAHSFRLLSGLLAAMVVLAEGAVSAGAGAGSSAGTPTSTPSTGRKPGVQPATLEGPITVGELAPPADPRPPDLEAIGYTQEEFFASGTATAYAADGELGGDGRWTFTPASTAPYKTRFIVRRPSAPDRFNGTVVVEWLNVTVVEAGPDWTYARRALVDDGAAWVGVSVQALGVVGGMSLIQTGLAEQQSASGGIRASNPERYGSLDHPGDPYAFDIYSQVGAALRSPGDVPVLGDGRARKIVAAGESQSAGFLTTYVNAIQPQAHVFDGFFVHSRGLSAAQPDASRPVRGSGTAYRFRPDLDVPVMVFETETDVGPVLRYGMARQPDNRRLRIWEVAGTAHADAYLLGGAGASLCPGSEVNNGPQHYVANAAMAALLRWVEEGKAPPRASRIRTTGDGTTIVRDKHGIAVGGIRTPSVDVPVQTLSGESQVQSAPLCAIFGSTVPFEAATLASLYPTKDAYLRAFDKALDRAIDKGFVRRADRAEYAAEAREVTLPG